MKCSEIIKSLEKWADPKIQKSWDNSGFLIGEINMKINKVLVALDCTDDVINEAIDKKANFIITHHPLIFEPEKSITDQTPLGTKILKLIHNCINVYSAHTNLDITSGGTNDTLFEYIALEDKENLEKISETDGLGRIGNLKNEITLLELSKLIKEKTNSNYVTYSGDKNKKIKRVGLCTGSAANKHYMKLAIEAGCQVYITGDIGYHLAQYALDMGLCLIDATHYYSEVIIAEVIANYLKEEFSQLDIEISKVNGQTLNVLF